MTDDRGLAVFMFVLVSLAAVAAGTLGAAVVAALRPVGLPA